MQDVIANAVIALWEQLQQRVIETASETARNVINKFINGFKQQEANIINISVETLTLPKLIEIASKHKVLGSTEVAAYKVATDDEYIIYLAYTKGKELLDPEVNNYVIVRSQIIGRDVDKLFNNEKLILLQ